VALEHWLRQAIASLPHDQQIDRLIAAAEHLSHQPVIVSYADPDMERLAIAEKALRAVLVRYPRARELDAVDAWHRLNRGDTAA
jgi:hypothetical protein